MTPEMISNAELSKRACRVPKGTLDSLLKIVDRAMESLKPSRRLSMEEFSRTLKIGEGREKGRRFNSKHQPLQRLWFQEFDIGRTDGQHNPRWTHFATCGCVQSGKSLLCFDIPILYYTLECAERVIVGVPTAEQASQKWEYELKPMIESSKYRWMLPKAGKGSRGGTDVSRIRFANGAELIFMTGHGGDEKRSSTTSRIVVITEADKMDKTGTTSKEADPVRQIIARTESFRDEDKIIIEECTVSTTTGRIWTDYTNGSAATLYAQCPLCGEWVSPGRDHLVGWIEQDNVIDAKENARWLCPACSGDITEHRETMIDGCRLAHRGQSLDKDGNVVGPLPKTEVFGFRWNAFFNKFWTTGHIAKKEWEANRSEDYLEANRAILQFTWAIPEDPPDLEIIPLDAASLRRKMGEQVNGKGIVPPDTKWLTIGVDVGKYKLSYVAIAAPEKGGAISVIDYGEISTHVKLQAEKAIPRALTELYNMAEQGYSDGKGNLYRPSMVFIDSRYETDKVKAWCRSLPLGSKTRYYPVQGLGETVFGARKYTEKKRKEKGVSALGERYHRVWHPTGTVHVFEIDVDHWKQRTHERLGMSPELGGAIRFYYSPKPDEHAVLVSHFTAEKLTEEFEPGKGLKIAWIKERKGNHYLDAVVYAQVALHRCGYRVERIGKQVAVSRSAVPASAAGNNLPTFSPVRSKQESFIPRGSGFLTGDGRAFKLKGG